MAEIIKFPQKNQRVAFFTETKLVIGTMQSQNEYPDGPVFILNNVMVVPFEHHVLKSDVLRFDWLCLRWDKVLGFANPPELEDMP